MFKFFIEILFFVGWTTGVASHFYSKGYSNCLKQWHLRNRKWPIEYSERFDD